VSKESLPTSSNEGLKEAIELMEAEVEGLCWHAEATATKLGPRTNALIKVLDAAKMLQRDSVESPTYFSGREWWIRKLKDVPGGQAFSTKGRAVYHGLHDSEEIVHVQEIGPVLAQRNDSLTAESKSE
jgi:hypothetical protein